MRAFLAPQLFNSRAEMLAPVLAACLGIGGSALWERLNHAKTEPCGTQARAGSRACAPAATSRLPTLRPAGGVVGSGSSSGDVP